MTLLVVVPDDPVGLDKRGSVSSEASSIGVCEVANPRTILAIDRLRAKGRPQGLAWVMKA